MEEKTKKKKEIEEEKIQDIKRMWRVKMASSFDTVRTVKGKSCKNKRALLCHSEKIKENCYHSEIIKKKVLTFNLLKYSAFINLNDMNTLTFIISNCRVWAKWQYISHFYLKQMHRYVWRETNVATASYIFTWWDQNTEVTIS